MASSITSVLDLEKVYKTHFIGLCSYAYQFVRDEDLCRDIVQSVFTKLWEKRNQTQFKNGIKSYLFGAVKNQAIDILRKIKSGQKYVDAMSDIDFTHVETPDDDLIIIRQKLQSTIETLKPKCKRIFNLHYKEGLTYAEIASHLSISKRTVEDNISRAYKQLREALLQDEEFKASVYLSLVVLLLEMNSLTEQFFWS